MAVADSVAAMLDLAEEEGEEEEVIGDDPHVATIFLLSPMN